MTKQKWLAAGLAAAVLCVICLGAALGSAGNKNAALKAQVDILSRETETVQTQLEQISAENEKLTEDVERLKQENEEYENAQHEAESGLENTAEQIAGMKAELENLERQNLAVWQEKDEIRELWTAAELELAALRQTDFTDETVTAALNEYCRLHGSRLGAPVGILWALGLGDWEDIYGNGNVQLEEGETEYGTVNPGLWYINTGLTYEKYRSEMLRFVSERLFAQEFLEWSVVRDGMLYIADVGATGMEYEAVAVEHIAGSYYRGTVKGIYINDSTELFTVEFGVEEQNGNCVISVLKWIYD